MTTINEDKNIDIGDQGGVQDSVLPDELLLIFQATCEKKISTVDKRERFREIISIIYDKLKLLQNLRGDNVLDSCKRCMTEKIVENRAEVMVSNFGEITESTDLNIIAIRANNGPAAKNSTGSIEEMDRSILDAVEGIAVIIASFQVLTNARLDALELRNRVEVSIEKVQSIVGNNVTANNRITAAGVCDAHRNKMSENVSVDSDFRPKGDSVMQGKFDDRVNAEMERMRTYHREYIRHYVELGPSQAPIQLVEKETYDSYADKTQSNSIYGVLNKISHDQFVINKHPNRVIRTISATGRRENNSAKIASRSYMKRLLVS